MIIAFGRPEADPRIQLGTLGSRNVGNAAVPEPLVRPILRPRKSLGRLFWPTPSAQPCGGRNLSTSDSTQELGRSSWSPFHDFPAECYSFVSFVYLRPVNTRLPSLLTLPLDFAFRVDDRLVSAQEVISIPWMTICMTDYPLITC
ncbi:hypothetical protein VTI28DRAFT_204 [Corynascus sepedonium]